MIIILSALNSFELKHSPINAIGMLLEQSFVIRRKTLAITLTLMASLAFPLMYKSVLISQLTKPDDPRHLDWISDIPIFGQSFRVFVWSPSFVADYVQTTYPELVKRGHFLLHNRPNDPDIFQQFRDGKLAFLEDASMTIGTYLNPELNPSMDCEVGLSDLHFSAQYLNMVYMGPIVSKRYPYKDTVKTFFGRMKEYGFDIYERSFHARHDYYPAKKPLEKPCAKPNIEKTRGNLKRCSTVKKTVHVLTTENLQQLFILYAAGNCLAFLVFLVEQCVFKFISRQKKTVKWH